MYTCPVCDGHCNFEVEVVLEDGNVVTATFPCSRCGGKGDVLFLLDSDIQLLNAQCMEQ